VLKPNEQEWLMREALKEARLGLEDGEAPIGSVIAVGMGDALRIVARGYNRVNGLQRKNAHAEIVAFENAGGNPPSLPLDAQEVTLVSTLEPCVMCLGAAMEVGVDLVVFGLAAPADSGTGRVRPPESPETKRPIIVGNVLATESRTLFQEWLENNRRSDQAEFVRQLLELTSTKSAGN
jgi:tRNA(adenine34) deaminase